MNSEKNSQIEPVLDHQAIEKLKSFDPQGKRKLVLTLIDLYSTGAHELIKGMKASIVSRDQNQIKFLAHKHKTTNLNLGLMRAYRILQELDQDSTPPTSQMDLVNSLEVELGLALKELKAVRESLS